jgi:dGTPase
MMYWHKLLSTKRFGMEAYHETRNDNRTEFQRDYDRLIFSASFRRLQNKTQVFPLPTNIFVHNRLTHSLEVACVGRSLGTIVAQKLGLDTAAIGSIVAAACLAHDMGNPPFGHSGETAIATYFSDGQGNVLKSQMNENQWKDLINFEGNANALRLLTHQFNGRRKGGFALTYSTLASIIKYPYPSTDTDTNKHKFGFFTSEKNTFLRITEELDIPKLPGNHTIYARHPLVFLVEAADDICYQIMDIEDAHKLKILSTDDTKSLLLNYFNKEQQQRRLHTLALVQDVNEQIAYLRSSVIGKLIDECATVFVENENSLLSGFYNTPLIKNLSPERNEAYKICTKTAIEKIYHSQEVLDVELAGYKIISTLLEHLISAVLQPNNAYSKQLLYRIPEQYETAAENIYGRVLSVLDYVSGMTDVYALDFYRKITGQTV